MRAVVQRVISATVSVDGKTVGSCGPGMVVFVGAGREDTSDTAKKLAGKVWGCRLFNDAKGKMNLSLADCEPPSAVANILVVSNFTLYGDTSQRRPSFSKAAGYEDGSRLFDQFVAALRTEGALVETGEFGADMQVALVADGPVTLLFDV